MACSQVDYENDDWEELHFDKIIVTAVRHRVTGEVRGYYQGSTAPMRKWKQLAVIWHFYEHVF